MQRFKQKVELRTSLKVNKYFLTLVEENKENYIFEVRFSVLRSEIFNKSLSKLIINVFNKNARKNSLTGNQILTNEDASKNNVNKDSGLFEIERTILSNVNEISNVIRKKNSIIETKQINLQSYINSQLINEFRSNKNIEDISLLRKVVLDLEESSESTLEQISNIENYDIKKLNHQIISQYLIHPADVVSNKFYSDNIIAKNIKNFYLFGALSSFNLSEPKLNLVKKSKVIDRVYIKTFLEIKKEFASNELDLEFELYKADNKFPIYRKKENVNVKNHIKNFNFSAVEPIARISNNVLQTSSKSRQDSFFVEVKEINNDGNISESKNIFYENFNHLTTEIDRNNASQSRQETLTKVDSTKVNRNISTFKNLQRVSKGKVLVYKVFSKDSFGNIVNPFFKSIIHGEPFKLDMTNLTIESTESFNIARIIIKNVPYYAKQYQIYRRSLYNNGIKNEFKIVSAFKDISNVNEIFLDTTAKLGQMYEYMVVYKCLDGTTKNSISQNYVHSVDISKVLKTTITPQPSKTTRDDTTVSFTINSEFFSDDSIRIRDILTFSNLGGDFFGDISRDEFKNSAFYKVTRVNLTTGEKETWEDIPLKSFGSGEIFFDDNKTSRRKYSIKDIDPNTNYKYEVRLFLKSPQSLLKNHIVTEVATMGDSGKKRTFTYSPYKWRQQSTMKMGMVLSQDNVGKMLTTSVFNENEVGIAGYHYFNSNTKNLEVKSMTAERVDFKKVKIFWSLSSPIKDYDHFVLIKEVNKKRRFIGAVFSQEYVDSLSDNDIGTIKYYIIPVLNDYGITKPAMSNLVVVNPEEMFE